MTALEQDIIDKFNQLDPQARIRLLIQLLSDMPKQAMTYKTWAAGVDQFRADLLAELGDQVFTGGLDLLQELREE